MMINTRVRVWGVTTSRPLKTRVWWSQVSYSDKWLTLGHEVDKTGWILTWGSCLNSARLCSTAFAWESGEALVWARIVLCLKEKEMKEAINYYWFEGTQKRIEVGYNKKREMREWLNQGNEKRMGSSSWGVDSEKKNGFCFSTKSEQKDTWFHFIPFLFVETKRISSILWFESVSSHVLNG